MDVVLGRYPVSRNKLYGQIKKYFSACRDYHAEEILERIENQEQLHSELFYHIEDAPILWLRTFLLNLGIEQTELEGNITINWGRTSNYSSNATETALYKKDTNFDKNDSLNIEGICLTFKDKFGATYDYYGENIRFIFEHSDVFDKFKIYALDLAKPYYTFEGDVLDIFNKAETIDNITILELSKD